MLALLLIGIWFTLAQTKRPALIFVFIVMMCGLALRWLTGYPARRKRKPSLLRQAIMEQLTAEALAKPKKRCCRLTSRCRSSRRKIRHHNSLRRRERFRAAQLGDPLIDLRYLPPLT